MCVAGTQVLEPSLLPCGVLVSRKLESGAGLGPELKHWAKCLPLQITHFIYMII